MNTWKVIFATLVIFGAGVVTGSLAVRSFSPKPPVAAPVQGQKESPPPWGFNNLGFLGKLERTLELSPAQKSRIEEIFLESQKRSKPMWQEIGPKLKEEVERVRDQVKAELNPEQQEKYEKMMRPRKKGDKEKSHDSKDPNAPDSEKKDEPHAGCDPSCIGAELLDSWDCQKS